MRYTQTGQKIVSDCNSIYFRNNLAAGGPSLLINDTWSLSPGESFWIRGNAGEVDTTQYTLQSSDNTTMDAGIIRKYYKD